MLFRLVRDGEQTSFGRLDKRSAKSLRLTEKDLENWLAEHQALLFGGEEVLVIAQSVQGRRMADILALDAEGNLVIVEIKRDWSYRETIGQLLQYAADMRNRGYEYLEREHRKYWERRHDGEDYECLLSRFRELSDDPDAQKDHIPKRSKGHRVCIVAPDSDVGLRRIIKWLKEYGVPISFIPFALYADADHADGEILLEIEQLPKVQEPVGGAADDWQGDWIFNTNEKHAPGAYRKMFKQNVIAIYGYPTGPYPLEGTEAGQRVFAYVNKRGILACGRVVDGQVLPGDTVFGEKREYHLRVEWETRVPDDCGVTNAEVRQKFDKWLPVRHVFCGLYHGMPDWISKKLKLRSSR